MVRLGVLICVAALSPSMAQADALLPSETVALVQRAMYAAGIKDVSPVAPSRAFPECSGTISVTPKSGSWSTVTLRCDAPFWQRSVRTRSDASDDLPDRSADPQPVEHRQVLGLRRSLAKGAVLSAEDLVQVSAPDLGPDQVFTSSDDLIGRRLDRAVGAGRPVLARHLQPDWKVLEGQRVLILSRSTGVEISMQGQAKMNGAVGDIIEVEAQGAGRTVWGRVIQKDIVEVTLKPSENGP